MEVKNTFEMNREELADYNKTKLMEFKKLFLNTDLSVDEIFTKINVSKGDITYRYIQGQRKSQGITAKDREVKFNVVEQSTEKRLEELEEFYQNFKKIWIENPKISKSKLYSQLGKTQKKEISRYVNQRLKEDGLPLNHNAHNSKGRPKKEKKEFIRIPEEEWEDKFQEYKKLFETTDLKIKEIYKKLGVPENANECYRYIRKRCKEEGLNGYKRSALKRDYNPLKSKDPQSKAKPKRRYTVEKVNEPNHQLENSMELLNRFFNERNIKSSTEKGYIATVTKWFKFTGDKYKDLQDNIDYYIKEEDERIPTRERSIKKEMLGFREALLEDKGIKSAKSVRSYFSKIGTIFRHFGLEIPELPQVKMEKGYVSSYNDLPTKDMIRTACEQSPVDLKALILFMSSSGSAKAETLSITVGMFLEGCKEYVEEIPTPNNIPETIKALSDKHDIVPMIYLRRIKTDKWYYTCCSPEASYIIFESLKIRKNLKWEDKLFDYTGSLILSRFQEINDNNDWGYVGAYRRFRSHALRKFMASNIGLPRDQVDSFQGRAKDMIQEAYFKQDPKSLKKIYLDAMHRIMIYDNWGHGTTPAELESKAKRLFNDFNDDEKILDLSNIPASPDEIKTSIGLDEEIHHRDMSTKNVVQNKSNTMPLSAPVEVPVGTVAGTLSISEELLNYAKLMDMGLISTAEFNRIKQKLLGALLI